MHANRVPDRLSSEEGRKAASSFFLLPSSFFLPRGPSGPRIACSRPDSATSLKSPFPVTGCSYSSYMHKPVKYVEKGLTMAARGAWVAFDTLNSLKPGN